MIQTTTTVERWRWTSYSRDCPRGSGYCYDQGERYELVKRWTLLGKTIWKRVIDREEIPSYVWIQIGCFGGYTGPWKSKFSKKESAS